MCYGKLRKISLTRVAVVLIWVILWLFSRKSLLLRGRCSRVGFRGINIRVCGTGMPRGKWWIGRDTRSPSLSW
jgi:hypothetical protein